MIAPRSLFPNVPKSGKLSLTEKDKQVFKKYFPGFKTDAMDSAIDKA